MDLWLWVVLIAWVGLAAGLTCYAVWHKAKAPSAEKNIFGVNALDQFRGPGATGSEGGNG